ncbi:MAG: hypothetical protein MJ252_13560, partial [archaeon]|nr:hypothetical protein [archaeon]
MKGFKEMKKIFDKMDMQGEDQEDEDYNENEGRNLVMRGNRSKVNKELNKLNQVKDKIKKYEGKNVSFKD